MRRQVVWVFVCGWVAACTFDPAGTVLLDGGSADGSVAADALSGLDDAALADAAPLPPPDAGPPDAMPPPPDARVCPPNFTVIPATGHAYRMRHQRQPWFQAEDSCEMLGDGIHLAIADDAAELAAIDMLVDTDAAWLGVNDVDFEGQFVKVTGGPATFLPWAPGEPNNAGAGEDCVELLGNQFNDRSCDATRAFLCECE